MISSLLYRLNHAALWRREMDVWDRKMRATSLDRLIALWLHRRGWMGRAEAILFRKLAKPGMQVVDVGANVGLYSLLLAHLVGPNGSVLAFEPEPNLFTILRENCRNNDASNVIPFSCALGRANGMAMFHRSPLNSGDNRLGRAPIGHETVEVRVERFDDLQPDRKLDFVKIDVQGHELAALSGMEQALSANPKVRVLFEFAPAALRKAGTEPDRLIEFFRERGFELYETKKARLKRLRNAQQLASDLGRRYTNLLAARGAVETDD
jgi:FkbM family methyltransferase